MQFNILVQLLDYYRDPHRAPFPSRAELGRRIGVKPKTIQTNMRQLEQAGLVRREMRKTAAGDWASNIYHLDGLVERVKKLEPEFTEARKEREAARARVSTPVGRRRS
jgi:predicted transcriptional regulator